MEFPKKCESWRRRTTQHILQVRRLVPPLLDVQVTDRARPCLLSESLVIPALSLNSIVGGLLLGLKKVSAKAIPTVIFAATDIIAAYIIVIVFKNHDLVVLSIAATVSKYRS
jgi:hypothetical protein